MQSEREKALVQGKSSSSIVWQRSERTRILNSFERISPGWLEQKIIFSSSLVDRWRTARSKLSFLPSTSRASLGLIDYQNRWMIYSEERLWRSPCLCVNHEWATRLQCRWIMPVSIGRRNRTTGSSRVRWSLWFSMCEQIIDKIISTACSLNKLKRERGHEEMMIKEILFLTSHSFVCSSSSSSYYFY
jgi:hypothetical protein